MAITFSGGIAKDLFTTTKRNNFSLVPRASHKDSRSVISVEPPPAALPHADEDRRRSVSALKLPSSISSLLHLHLSAVEQPKSRLPSVDLQTPSISPRDDISSFRSSIHGSGDWSPLLDPLHSSLRREIIKYGEFSQATYDAFDSNPVSDYHGSCLYGRHRLLPILGLSRHGYSVTEYIYATSHHDISSWLVRPLLPSNSNWCDESNWMGNITIAWRGTMSPAEWLEDLQSQLKPLPGAPDDGARVEQGFLSIYTSRSKSSRYTQSSASDQVMSEILRLVKFYKQRGETVSVTITGHSLGGALALLNAAEAASLLPEDVGVAVISFGAPRVGNQVFGEMLKRKGVKILRVVTKQDVVPKMPGIVFNEGRKGKGWEWVYAHVGDELTLDITGSPYLKKGAWDLAGFHGLETYLHLVDGYERPEAGFRAGARRDVALVNKASGLLRVELGIPASWHQRENKGMVRNEFGRWVLPRRDPEDIPTPCAAGKPSCASPTHAAVCCGASFSSYCLDWEVW
ncbi:hypothetical protein KSP40_PGU017401 [Platanthera guangdongensis]|uniref:Fungal lipase-type domain-containing protein n=1 Tax=Platanthera guangdongensis TaxID=2320717 RepID=A0ABR2MG49_9ASPA